MSLKSPNRLWLAALLAGLGAAPAAFGVSLEGKLQTSTDLQTWTDVPISAAQLNSEGQLIQDPGTKGFFRLQLTPLPIPAGTSLIPSGSYQMGDALDNSANTAVHTVSVKACYLEKYEVTKALWDEVRTWGIAHGYDLPVGVAKSTTDPVNNYPVHTISWYAVVRWCNARSEKAGLTPPYKVNGETYKTGATGAVTCDWTANGYRLPTEAEWEKAARGGLAGKRFPSGDTLTHAQANYVAANTLFSYDTETASGYPAAFNIGEMPYTSPVGSFASNGYGLYDMAGNVAEWCWDLYDSGYYASSPINNPTGPETGAVRVVRGGSWFKYADVSRVANRSIFDPANGGSDEIGFRCVLP
ncbi:formylglycine-generating enzyme family protein [Rariglobus hedericola]|uniref:Formylglycine-generating enzyme family protein n=1 Tax=Rariglobus hedericola TaxID=2597822 RepID=A0A556QIU4_9BACT|nr:SUMF1/EgtB/PvdO family nonheme iron enzyme [Rariglobus hedericola]TSJ76560.1 formylglycine-generating enzyme family protein [Rariglobus hedericola]